MHQLQFAVHCFSSPIQKKVFDITITEIRCPDPGYGKHVVRTGTSFMYQSEVSDFVDGFNICLTAPPGFGVLKISHGTNTSIKGQQ